MNDDRAAGEPYTQPATFHFRRYESLNHSCGSPLMLPKESYNQLATKLLFVCHKVKVLS
jgi:hypothetical protein